MDNSPQLLTMDKLSVTYQHGILQTDISNLQTSEIEILEINWFGKPSSQEEYTCCREEISGLLESHKFPKVKKLVLNNLFYLEELVKDLTTKFPNIEHLKILPFNSKNDRWFYDTYFYLFNALSELEIAFEISDDIKLHLPRRLKELTLSISKVASERIVPVMFQCIYLTTCRSLESL